MKKNFLSLSVWMTTIAGLLLGACATQPADGPAEEPAPTEIPSELDATNLNEELAPGQVVSAHDLLILDSELISKMEPIENNTVTAAQLDSVGGVIQFSGVDENLIQVGEIINAGSEPKTPDGLLRIVEHVETDNGMVQATTRQATLEEAIQDGYFSVDYSQFSSSDAQPGGGKLTGMVPNPARITQPIDEVLYNDGKGGRVTAKGEITVIPDFDLGVEVADLEMEFFEFVNKTTVEANITIDTGVEYSKNVEIKVLDLPLGKLDVPVKGMKIPLTENPLVIVIQPRLIVSIGLDGQVHAGVEMGGVYTNTIDSRATWTKEIGYWEFSKISNPKFTFNPPVLKTEAYAKVFARPRLQLMMFGIVGPYAQLEGYYRLDASPQDNPWWTLRISLDGEIGIRFELFNFIKAIPIVEPIQFYDEIIQQAPLESPQAPEPPPEEPSQPGGDDAPAEEPNQPGESDFPPEEDDTPPDAPPPAETGNENILLIYDDTAAFVINITQSAVRVNGLEFKRVDNQGSINASYQADMWGNFYSGYDLVQPEYCLRIALPDSSTAPGCTVQVNYETRQEGFHFWRQTSTSQKFQVLRNNTLLQTCEISDGSCRVYVPQP